MKIDPRVERCHAVDIHVGIRVRQRRKALQPSQSQLANKLGLTFQQVQKYERGLNRISASKLWEIAKILQVTVAWLFEGFTESELTLSPTAADDVAKFLTTNDAIGLGQAYLGLPTYEQRRSVVDLMRTISAENRGALTAYMDEKNDRTLVPHLSASEIF